MMNARSSAPEAHAIGTVRRWLTGRTLLVCVLGALVMVAVGVILSAAAEGQGVRL